MLHYIKSQDKLVTSGEFLQPVYRPMCPLAHSVGKAIGDKAAFKVRFNDVAQCMMHHSVAERRGTNQAAFWLADGKMVVLSGPVSASSEIGLQIQ